MRWQRSVRESETQYRAILDSLDDFVFTLDAGQHYAGAFGRWTRAAELDPKAIVGRMPAEVFGGECASRHDAAFRRVLGGATADYDWTHVRNGARKHFRTSLSPLRDDAGNVTGAAGVTRDVTERTMLDDAYQQTNELLHAIVAASPLAIFTLDDQGRIRGANSAAESVVGKSQDQLLGELLVRPAESNDVARLLRECAASGQSFTGAEVVRWRDDGSRVVLSVSAAPLAARSDGPRGVVALADDISERRRAGEMLQRYCFMTQHIRDVVIFVGAAGHIVDANEAAVRAYGWSREELINLPFGTIGALELGQGIETEHTRRDGTRFPVEVSAVSAEIDGQRCVFVLARDISQRRRRQAFERLLHEIDRRILQSQPLDAILGFTCAQLAELYGCALVQLSLRGEDGKVTIRKAAGPGVDFLDTVEVRWDESMAGQGPTGTAIRTGQIQCRDLTIDPGFAPWRQRAIEYGLHAAVALPLIAKDQVLGAVTLFTGSFGDIDKETVNLLFAFADQIALSLLAAKTQEQIALQTVALESAANAIVVTEANGTIKWVNPAFERLTGFAADEAIGARPSILKSGNHSPVFYKHMWETVRGGGTWTGELWNRRKDGTLYIEEQTITPVRADDGRITHFVAIKQDVTARRRQEDQIRHLAMHDALTDLPNRRALDGAMERISWEARRGKPGALMILDVDNFKPVNDTLGHIGGDQLLAELARLLRDALRPGDFLARLGGDEFAVLVQDTAIDGARAIAERLRNAVCTNPFRFGDRLFDLTISIGIAPIDSATDAAVAMIHADSAMYAAKNGGKNRLEIYPFGEAEGMRLIEASRWASRINSALRDERFTLCYQPVVRLGSNEPEHYEALIRMIDEEGNVVAPDDFISAAERFGLMPQIDRWVVQNVLRVLEASETNARIFVNISGASLGDEELLAFIERAIVGAAIPAGRLAFEITESAAIRDLAAAQSWIRKLKDLGCLFAIDDFGVGFSSFSYLRALSADYVKIDRSFVSDVDTNPTNRALVQAVMTVAQTLGKEVIAEGVETDAHAAVLRELGIELAQGFRWGVPLAEPFALQVDLAKSFLATE